MWLKIHLSDFAAEEAQSFRMSKSFLRKQQDRDCEDRLQSAWFIRSSCSCSSHLWLSGSGTAMTPCCSVSWAGWFGLMPHTGWLWLLWSEDPHVQCTAVYHWCTVALFTQRQQVQLSNLVSFQFWGLKPSFISSLFILPALCAMPDRHLMFLWSCWFPVCPALPCPIPYEVVSIYYLIMIKIVGIWASALDSCLPKIRHVYK